MNSIRRYPQWLTTNPKMIQYINRRYPILRSKIQHPFQHTRNIILNLNPRIILNQLQITLFVR